MEKGLELVVEGVPPVEGDQVEIIGGLSPAWHKVQGQLQRIARSNCRVLITGETGVGKDLVARQIHLLSHRKQAPFVRVDMAAMGDPLMAARLFGHVRGAYTGAVSDSKGFIEVAEGGTIFFDEIGEIDDASQAKLLVFSQTGEYQRVGSTRTMRANVRVIAATNRDLAREVDAKRFRRDLFHRLAVISLNLPPLRRRIEDMPHLLEHMLAKHAPSGGAIPPVDETTVAFLKRYSWPGNIRELENLVEAFYVLGDGDFATFVADRLAGMETTHELPSHAVALPAGRMEFATALKQVADTDLTLEAVRYLLAVEAMERSNNNKSQAARLLGCSFKSLDNWLRHK